MRRPQTTVVETHRPERRRLPDRRALDALAPTVAPRAGERQESLDALLTEIERATETRSELRRDRTLARYVAVVPDVRDADEDLTSLLALGIRSLLAPEDPTGSGRRRGWLRGLRDAWRRDRLAKRILATVQQRVRPPSPAVLGMLCVSMVAYVGLFLLLAFSIGKLGNKGATFLSFPNEHLIVAVLGGGLGSVVSMLSRIPSLARQRRADRAVLLLTGVTKPLIGTASALFVYAFFTAGLSGTTVTAGRETAFFAAICFVAGFSERLVPDLATQVEGKASPPKPDA